MQDLIFIVTGIHYTCNLLLILLLLKHCYSAPRHKKVPKTEFFCKPHISMMNVAINAIFGVDVCTTITHLLH